MFGKMKKIQYMMMAVAAMMVLTACEKVSPIGVLVSGTGVEDRVKMSHLYYQEHKEDYKYHQVQDQDEYTFLVGADSHLTTDDGRMREMLQIGLDNNDLLYAHLGDIADTKAEYYITLEDLIDEFRWKYAKKNYKEVYFGDDDYPEQKEYDKFYVYVDTLNDMTYSVDEVPYPFYPVVGNHDITHNGWALWSNIFHSSFYDVLVLVNMDPIQFDHFIFLDSANGTLGEEQVKLIEQGVLDGLELAKELGQQGSAFRHTFVFSHTNMFRPSSLQFSSTFAREETFFLLKQFEKWDADIVFLGHVHKWDYQKNGKTEYLTLDTMCEKNNPDPGDYLVRVHVKKDGTIKWEQVRMNYTPKK
jgi:predicted phosphodiesterase